MKLKQCGRFGLIAALLSAAVALGARMSWGQDSSRVCVSRGERVLLPPSVLAPSWVYPEGKLDYFVVEGLLDKAVASLTGETSVRTAWSQLFRPSDRVGVQIDVPTLPVHQALIEAVIRRLTRAGVSTSNIIIYAGDENALFYAGFDLRHDGDGVQVMGSDSEGFRGGLSRIVLDYCTAIINLSRLRVDPQIGMSGALANCLAAVPHVERERLRRAPETLAAAAARATLRRKLRLHIMDALQPAYEPSASSAALPTTWVYGGVLASYDPVAMDIVGREILLEKLRETDPQATELQPPVTYLEPACERYHLGQCDRAKIEIVTIGPESG